MTSPSSNNEDKVAWILNIELKREEPEEINKDEGIKKAMEAQAPVVKEDTSSDKDEAPLPQPGDMHVEFKKSGLPDRAKKPKIEFIPFRLLEENKQELCKRVLSLEREIKYLKEQNTILKRKLRKKSPSLSPPPPPPRT